MIKWIVLLFFVIEIFLTIELGVAIGGFNLFLEIFLTAIFGGLIIKNFKMALTQSITAIMMKQSDIKELIKGNLIGFIGALLLVIPGVVTDSLGFIMLLIFVKNVYLAPKQAEYRPTQSKFEGEDDVIDVEIIEHISTTK